MLFNSLEFAIFLPIVFVLYWFVTNRNLKVQNILLIAASYVFYGWWDWRFLSLIIFSSFVDFFVGLKLDSEKNDKSRKLWLATSICVNLGFLGFFKYYNFFVDNFVQAFTLFGKELNVTTLKIILPVGISFYTFQTLSYSIDIYRRKLKPTKDYRAFFAFVSFFPQLVAGPIERATNLLPQFYKKRSFNYAKAVDGMRQVLWGLFKKIVIADNCAVLVNEVFANHHAYSGSELILGSIYFAFQIYGDFSGYSDIAIGTSRLFGFDLKKNFAFPYFSRDIAEFWRRWHISLSTWFRDYLYIPLGGSRGGKWQKIRNTFAIFLVSGFWHGANWTFIVWGFLNALYFLPLMLLGQNRSNLGVVAQGKLIPSFKEVTQVSLTFILTILAWVFFRATSIDHAFSYLGSVFSKIGEPLMQSSFSYPGIMFFLPIPLILFFLAFEWLNREKEHGLVIDHYPVWLRWVIYIGLIYIGIIFGEFNQLEFIYFQF